jgi:hypothetical protein
MAVKVFTRRGNDWTNRFRKIAADARRTDAAAPCPLCNPDGVFDFAEPIRSVGYFGAAVGMQNSSASRKRRNFFVTDDRCLSLHFQFRRSTCRSGRAVNVGIPAKIGR